MSDFDLALIIGDKRYGSDESEARMVPLDLTFSTTWQGGPKQLDCSLLRSLNDRGSERPFDDVTLVRTGGQSVWEGRLQRLPRTVTRRTIRQSPQALGLAAILEDRQDARALFIDRDLAKWHEPTIVRRNMFTATPLALRGAAAGDGALRFDVSGQWDTIYGRPASIAVYEAAPLKVGQLMWGSATATNMSGGHWVGEINRQKSSGYDGSNALPDFFTVDNGDQGPLTADINEATAEIVVYTGIGSASQFTRTMDVRNLLVTGDQGLPLVGSSAADYGIKASDAWRWLIDTYCEGLQPGDIVDSQFGIPHLAFTDPQTAGSIWNGINAYHGWAWGVWEDGRVDANPYGEGRSQTWYVRAGDAGVELQQDGDDAAALWTDIVVSYQTPDGQTRTVGGTGTVADAVDSTLSITDPLHPAVAAGVKRVYHFALDAPTIQQTAAAVGQTMLAQLNAARRAGSLDVRGYVYDALGRPVPSYMVRGGDQLVVTDVGDATPRRVVDTLYTHATRNVRCTLDNTLQTVEAIVAHLGARTTGRL